MLVIHEMLKNEEFDGDKCAEILFEGEELVNGICSYDNHDDAYVKLAMDIEDLF
jgi:hypothetical protein